MKTDHRTQADEDPNIDQCMNWVLGTGKYVKSINRVRGTLENMIKGVKWSKVVHRHHVTPGSVLHVLGQNGGYAVQNTVKTDYQVRDEGAGQTHIRST